MDFLDVLQIILIVLKLLKLTDISWGWVFTPLYIAMILSLLKAISKEE